VALFDQIPHHRILLRQIKDIVFHDPGRDNQDRLSPHGVREWRVLDKLDQSVAVNDLSRCPRNVPAWLERVGTIGHRSCHRVLQVLQIVLCSPDKIQAARVTGLPENLGVGP